MTQRMPISVSPSFMLETSTAIMGVSSLIGLIGIGLIAGWMDLLNGGDAASCAGAVGYSSCVGVQGWNSLPVSMFLSVRRLSSMNCWGSCRSWIERGKLYFGVVVYWYCSINRFTN